MRAQEGEKDEDGLEQGKSREEQKRPASESMTAAQSPKRISGADKINSSRITRSKSSGAQIFGVTSFEATGSGMGSYMKQLKEKVWLSWFPYLAFHFPRDFKSADALIEFRLNRLGEVKSVLLIDQQGSALFGSFCMEAIQRASPFGPLPEEILVLLGKDDIDIQFSFHYW
jgi:hypothetical protein